MRELALKEINVVTGGTSYEDMSGWEKFWASYATGAGFCAGVTSGPFIAVGAAVGAAVYYLVYTPLYYVGYGVAVGTSYVASGVASGASYVCCVWQTVYRGHMVLL